MNIQWSQVFLFPLRRPAILVQLWLLHLVPFLAIIPLAISGSLTAVGALIASHEKAFMAPLAALGAGTVLAYLFFAICALVTGLYPLGYLRDTMRAVATRDCNAPLPMGSWWRRCLTGLYMVLIMHSCMLLAMLPVGLALALVTGLGGQELAKTIGNSGLLTSATILTVLAAYALSLGLFMLLVTGAYLRVSQTFNPLRVLNPLGICGDLLRGWKDYLVLNLGCLALYFFFVAVSTIVILAAPFLVSGPLLLVPGILVGLAQNYLLLAAGQAGGQYVQHYCR